jgi:hypothetical protein
MKYLKEWICAERGSIQPETGEYPATKCSCGGAEFICPDGSRRYAITVSPMPPDGEAEAGSTKPAKA